VIIEEENEKEEIGEKYSSISNIMTEQKDELGKGIVITECAAHEAEPKFSMKQGGKQNHDSKKFIADAIAPKAPSRESNEEHSKGWQTIPKPKGHSALDYARWDSVEDDSSDDDGDSEEEESLPQYRFRVRTIGVRPVK